MSRFDDIQRDYLEAVNQVRTSFGMAPTDNASDGAWEVMANHSPESFNSYSDNSAQSTAQPEGYQQTQNLGISDPFASSANSEKWYAGDRPTYAESFARLYAMQGMLPPEQFNALTAELDKMKHDLSSGFYQNWYETITSPYVDAIAKLGIDVSGGINDDWIAKNQYLLQGARYTDAGTTPAAPTKNSTAAQNAAYYYYQIQRNYADTKEVLNEEAALKDEIAYWVSRDDLNLSDQQILDQLDWKGKYKYLQGLKDAQGTGKQYNYTQPIDYNPDNLRGYIWAARNGGGSGNDELDAINAALGRGNVWQENKEISGKLDFHSDNFSPYSVKSTLDDEAQYFGVKEFAPGWAEEAAKSKIDWNNPEDVKHWQKVYNAETFTAQAEAEVKEIYNRIDTMIAAGITDPAVIEDGLWEKGLDGSAALNALKKLDASMVRPDKLEDTTRPIDYRKQDVLDYINQQCAKATEKESLSEFGTQMDQVMNADSSPEPTQMPTPAPRETPRSAPEPTPTPTPMFGQTASASEPRQMPTPAPRETPRPVPEPTPTPAPMFGQTASATEPAPMPVPAPRETPRPVPIVDQSARAVNKAQTQNVLDAAKTILTTGTPDEKQVLNLAPTVNAEGVAAEMANSVQNGKADAGSLYESTAKQAQEFTATHYVTAKMATQFYEDLQAKLAKLQAQQAEIQKQYDQVQYQVDRGIVPGVASKEVQIDGETHVLTADYDPTSREYIINDSNPTSSAEVERQKEEYANTLRYGLNMEETYAEKDNQLLVAAEDLNMQLTAINQQVANAQKAVDDYKMRYDQAQGELKNMNSMYDATAAQLVMSEHPGIDLSTPQGQQALTEAKAKVKSLTNSVDLVMSVGSQYTPTEWAPNTVFQYLTEKGASLEQNEQMAQEIIAESTREIDQLNQAMDQMQAAGMAIPGDWVSNINRSKEKNERDIQEAKDFLVQTQSGFEEAAAKGQEAVKNDKQHQYSELSKSILDPGSARTTVQGQEMSFVKFVNAMTDDEKKTYAAYLAGEGGEKAAVEYFERLTDPSYGILQTRVSGNMQKAVKEFAEKAPALAFATSIAASPLTITGAGYTLYSLLAGKEINPSNEWFYSTTGLGTMESVSKEAIKTSAFKKDSLGYNILGVGLDGLSAAGKSTINSLIMGPLVGGITNNIVREAAAAIPMALQSAGATAQEIKTRGGSDLQAALEFGLDFSTNVITEALTYGNIEDAFNHGAEGVRAAQNSILKNPWFEEMLGEGAGYIANYVGDDVIMGKLSEREQKITEYEQTMSHDDAVRAANYDFWKGLVYTELSTAVSTTASQGASYVAGLLNSTPSTTQPSAEGQVRATALANGLPLDRATQDMTNRTLTLLTSSLNAGKGSQVQALSAALFPVSGDAQGQRAAISAGLHLANQMGAEQAVAVAQDVILAAEQEGADQQAVRDALRTAALGQGEASAVLSRISQNGVEFGDVQALVDAAGRDAQNPAIAKRMQAVIHNDRVAGRTRDLIGQGALNGVKPYEQAYSQAKAQEAQTQQNLEAEQERAQTMGENLKTVQGQHAADPANPALAGAMKQATKDMVGQVKVVGEYQQGLENQQQKTRDAEKDLNRVREEAMTKVREQAMADVAAEEQAEAQAKAKQAEKERQFWIDKYKKKYPNAEGEFDRVGHNPSLKTEDYTITPVERDISTENITAYSLEGFTVKFNHPLSEAEINLLNERGEYNEETREWHSNNQSALQDIGKTQDEVKAILAQANSGNQKEATSGSNPNAGTVYTNDQGTEQPVEGLRGGKLLGDGKIHVSTPEYFISPDPSGGYFIKFKAGTKPSQSTIESLESLGMEYDDLLNAWHGDATPHDIQAAYDSSIEGSANYDDLVAQRDQLVQQRDAYQAQLDNNEFPQQWQQSAAGNKVAILNKTIQELDAKIAEVQKPATPANNPNVGTLNTNGQDVDTDLSLDDTENVEPDLSAGAPPSGNGPGVTLGGQPNNGPMRHFNAETGQKSDIFFDSVKKHLIETGALTRDKNSEQINRATEWVRSHANENDTTGYYGALVEAQSPDFNALSVDGQARVYVLAAMAGMQNDVGAQMALADILTNSRTESGRALQFGKVYTLMSPMGRIATLQKVEAQINEDFARRSKKPIKLSEDTIRAASEAKTQEEFDAVRAKAQKELAAQIPTDWKGKLQAYRIWSMLSGPKTHFKNFFGNAMFIPAVSLKNVIGTGLEATIGKGLNMQERTKSLTVSKENRAFAKQDAVKMQDVLTGEAKYTDKQKVLQNRKLFGTKDTVLSKTFGKAMQWLMDKNSTALEKEDWFYLKRHYASALGQWMQANKVTPETITAEQLNKARDYAVNEAQKATYRDASEFASTLSKIVNKGGFFGWAVDSANPFRKTPTNIMKRGIEYSPVGLIKTLVADTAKLNNYNNWVENGAKGKKPDNAISPNQYIDNLASGLSGTAFAAIGYALAKMGFVTVKLDDDEDEFDERAGKQNYGINISIGGVDFSYTMDWAAPSSLPFFVGASLYKATQKEDWDAGKVTDALLEILDPMFDLSMLDGLNSLFENSQWSGTTSLGQIGEKLVTNYANSFIPSWVGAVSRTIDPVRRRNYVESGASLSTWKYAFEQAQNKTPYSVSNIPYRDVWGKEDRSPWMMAAFENFVSPGYISRIKPEKVDEELRKLYDETKDKTVIPKAASKTANVNGQSIKLNAEQYDKLVVSRGGTAKSILEELMSRPEWLVWNADQKINMISDVWSYANATATAELFPELKLSSWVKEARRGGKAADVIVNRSEEKAKKEYVDGHKTSLFKAVDEHDTEAFNTSMFALMDADKKDKEAQGKKQNPAYVNNLLVNHYKPLYIEAFNDGDAEAMEKIKDDLLNMPMTGINAKTIFGWEYEAEKEKAKKR